MDIDDKIKQFCRRGKITLMVLFGSRAKNKTHDRSDFDIAILSNIEKISSKKLYYIGKLEQIYKTRIDLVILNHNTDPLLLNEIFQNGKPIYEEREGVFREQQYRAWTKYLDTRNLREKEKQYIKSFGLEKRDVS